MELESYFDAVLGVFVMNVTDLPTNECQHLKSIADLSEASLYRSKLGNFSILRYEREKWMIS